jgi:hypothetical protein
MQQIKGQRHLKMQQSKGQRHLMMQGGNLMILSRSLSNNTTRFKALAGPREMGESQCKSTRGNKKEEAKDR